MTTSLETRFAAAWRAAGAPRRLLLAISGGGDSMALMRLAALLTREGADILVATVDHGLRPSSAAEAGFVSHEAAARGLASAVLRWEGEKPASGLQSAARNARYRLLAAEAARIGADAILTAHTADDQAETLLMRMSHRTGVRGLAGMAVESQIADGAGAPQRLLRLLLGESRAALRQYLAAAGARFIDDPSNDDPRFERVRVRRTIDAASDREALLKSLSELSACARDLRSVSDRMEVLQFHRAGGEFLADGSVRLSSIADPVLAARLFQAAGAGEHAPSEEAAAAALATARSGKRTTLAGAVLDWVGNRLLFRREPAAVLGRGGAPGVASINLLPGGCGLWDQRFIVRNVFEGPVQVRALGAEAAALGDDRLPALDAAPGLFLAGRLSAFPGDAGAGDTAVHSLVAERFNRRVNRF